MKWDILFLHKNVAITCKENMSDANEYEKILEPPSTLQKIANSKNNELI
jgi:hypothetical protein